MSTEKEWTLQKPSLGRIVIAAVSAGDNNGATGAPAVITRVWSDAMVNIRVLNDGPAIEWKTSVTLYDTAEDLAAAKAQRDEQTPSLAQCQFHGAYWPARV